MKPKAVLNTRNTSNIAVANTLRALVLGAVHWTVASHTNVGETNVWIQWTVTHIIISLLHTVIWTLLSLTKHYSALTAAKYTVFPSLCISNIRINIQSCIKISFYNSRAFKPTSCPTSQVNASNIDLPTVTLRPIRDLLHGSIAINSRLYSQLSVQLRSWNKQVITQASITHSPACVITYSYSPVSKWEPVAMKKNKS